MRLFLWQTMAQTACQPPVEIAAGQFEGLILSYQPSEGVRALRPELATTYYIAFDGANFTAGGAVSPDGRYYAVPNGVIQTNNSADIRHVVQEIRVITTETVPRIIARIPWQASFPVGTRFAHTQGIPTVYWLGEQQFTFPAGSMNAEQVWQRVDFSTSPSGVEPFEAGAFAPFSADGGRGLRPDGGGWTIYDLATQGVVGRLPRLSAAQDVVWSPDGARLAALVNRAEGTRLELFWRGGAEAAVVAQAEAGWAIWNVRWSPDGARLAYALYDPEANQSRLYLYEVATAGLTEMCLDLTPHPQALAWSDDGERLAVLTAGNGGDGVYAFDVNARTLSFLSPYTGGLLGWFGY